VGDEDSYERDIYQELVDLVEGEPAEVRPLKVLEIGAGHDPSCQDGSLVATRFNVDRLDVNLPQEMFEVEYDNEAEKLVLGSYRPPIRVTDPRIAANAHGLPFPDTTFDLVIMKSVFGMFTGRSIELIEDMRWFGMLEFGRVLKPGGLVFCFEENTPWERGYIQSYGESASLAHRETSYEEDGERYAKFREALWGSEPRGMFGTHMVAMSRFHGVGDTAEEVMEVVTNSWQRHIWVQERGYSFSPFPIDVASPSANRTQLNFQMPKP